MRDKQINYVMSHPAHLPYLVTSLLSLRNHWDGHICVYAWPQSIEIVKQIATDTKLDIECIEWHPEYLGKNDQFECKQRVMLSLKDECKVGLYLDADTMIAGDLSLVFEEAEQHGFCATQFGTWKTKGGVVQARIKRLRDYPEIDQVLVETVLKDPWPSVNGGVFACRPESVVLKKWHEWTKIVRKIFISDETVLHTLLPRYWCGADYPYKEMELLEGGRYNCSPKYQPKELKDSDIIVWHFHGDSNTRWQKSLRGVKLWYPVYQYCLHFNVGRMAEWIDQINYKYLNALQAEVLKQGDPVSWPD